MKDQYIVLRGGTATLRPEPWHPFEWSARANSINTPQPLTIDVEELDSEQLAKVERERNGTRISRSGRGTDG